MHEVHDELLQAQLLDDAVATYGTKEEAARGVATPDTSSHVTGDAVDLGPWPALDWLAQNGAAYTNGGVIARHSGTEERFLLHRTEEEDAQRAEIYASRADAGGIMYGNPKSTAPLWLIGNVEEETAYFHGLLQGAEPDPEFAALTDGSAARASIATADALTLSLAEDRKVRVAELAPAN